MLDNVSLHLSFLLSKRADSEPPEEKESTPKNRRENQILPPVLSIDFGRWKNRAAIPTEALSKDEEQKPQRLRSSWLMNP